MNIETLTPESLEAPKVRTSMKKAATWKATKYTGIRVHSKLPREFQVYVAAGDSRIYKALGISRPQKALRFTWEQDETWKQFLDRCQTWQRDTKKVLENDHPQTQKAEKGSLGDHMDRFLKMEAADVPTTTTTDTPTTKTAGRSRQAKRDDYKSKLDAFRNMPVDPKRPELGTYGDKPMKHFDVELLAQIARRMEVEPCATGQPASAATIRARFSALSMMCKRLDIPNPVSIERLQLARPAKPTPKHFLDIDIERIVPEIRDTVPMLKRAHKLAKGTPLRIAANGERVNLGKIIIRILLYAGLPQIGIKRLLPDSMDLDGRQAALRGAEHVGPYVLYPKRLKGKTAPAQWQWQLPGGVAAFTDFAALDLFGWDFNNSAINSMLKSAIKRAAKKIDDPVKQAEFLKRTKEAHAYLLRHTFITRVARQRGFEAAAAAAQHTNSRMAREVYAVGATEQIRTESLMGINDGSAPSGLRLVKSENREVA